MSHFDTRMSELLADPQARENYERAKARGREYELRPQPLLPTLWAQGTVQDAKKRARLRGMEFGLSAAFILRLLEQQQFRCAVSGIAFSDAIVNGAHKRPYMPSIDRIDCSKGYTPDNVRIVCVVVNTLLQDWGDSVFHEIVCAYLAK